MPLTTFNQILDAIEALPSEQQAGLLNVIRRRLAALGREQIAIDAPEARAEFAAGKTRPTSVDNLMREFNA